LIALIKSLLDDAGIRYLAKGDDIQDLFGWGRFGTVASVVGPVEFFVASEEAVQAREILAHLEGPILEAPTKMICASCDREIPESRVICPACNIKWPADAPLTAAEALLLLEPNEAQGKAALKLTLLELLAQRRLTVHRQDRAGFLGIRRTIDLLECAPEAAQQVPVRSHVREVLGVLRAAGASTGMPMKQVVAAMREAFGTDLSGYQTRHLVPELVARGLLEAYQTEIFWVFSETRYRCTPAGEAARSQLELLLVGELPSHYAQLSQALRMYRADSGSAIESDLNVDFDASSAGDGGWEAFDAGFDTADGGNGGNGEVW
jgi:hypothetical protein